MKRRHTAALATGVALVIALGIGVAVAAEMEAIRREYDQRLRNTDTEDVDQLMELAKWCYQHGLTDEALKHAQAAHKLAPKDVRAKYLMYAATTPEPTLTTTTTGETGPTVRVEPLPESEVDAIFEREGLPAMNGFRRFQALLVRRCGSPKCHGGNPDAKFTLVKLKPETRQTRAQNFKAIQGYLDRERPDDSRLFDVPMKGREANHPNKAIRSRTDAVYRFGVQWVESLLTQAERVWRRSEEREEPGPGAPPGLEPGVDWQEEY